MSYAIIADANPVVNALIPIEALVATETIWPTRVHRPPSTVRRPPSAVAHNGLVVGVSPCLRASPHPPRARDCHGPSVLTGADPWQPRALGALGGCGEARKPRLASHSCAYVLGGAPTWSLTSFGLIVVVAAPKNEPEAREGGRQRRAETGRDGQRQAEAGRDRTCQRSRGVPAGCHAMPSF